MQYIYSAHPYFWTLSLLPRLYYKKWLCCIMNILGIHLRVHLLCFFSISSLLMKFWVKGKKFLSFLLPLGKLYYFINSMLPPVVTKMPP